MRIPYLFIPLISLLSPHAFGAAGGPPDKDKIYQGGSFHADLSQSNGLGFLGAFMGGFQGISIGFGGGYSAPAPVHVPAPVVVSPPPAPRPLQTPSWVRAQAAEIKSLIYETPGQYRQYVQQSTVQLSQTSDVISGQLRDPELQSRLTPDAAQYVKEEMGRMRAFIQKETGNSHPREILIRTRFIAEFANNVLLATSDTLRGIATGAWDEAHAAAFTAAELVSMVYHHPTVLAGIGRYVMEALDRPDILFGPTKKAFYEFINAKTPYDVGYSASKLVGSTVPVVGLVPTGTLRQTVKSITGAIARHGGDEVLRQDILHQLRTSHAHIVEREMQRQEVRLVESANEPSRWGHISERLEVPPAPLFAEGVHNPLNSGPLSEIAASDISIEKGGPSIASTFRSHTYEKKFTNNDPLTVWRFSPRLVTPATKFQPRFYMRNKPEAHMCAYLDNAIVPQWNKGCVLIKTQIPADQVYYEGLAAAQGGPGTGLASELVGGGKQIFIEDPKLEWIIEQTEFPPRK